MGKMENSWVILFGWLINLGVGGCNKNGGLEGWGFEYKRKGKGIKAR